MTFWKRLQRCWKLLWNPAAFTQFDSWEKRIATVEAISDLPAAIYLFRAMEKTAIDKSFHPTKDHELKRKETLEWMGHYCKDAGVEPLKAWEASFLLEWLIGERKGRL